MSRGATPSCSAQIWANAVFSPCPIAAAPVKTDAGVAFASSQHPQHGRRLLSA
jgi:hypothetical protein